MLVVSMEVGVDVVYVLHTVGCVSEHTQVERLATKNSKFEEYNRIHENTTKQIKCLCTINGVI
jgi:hypothetical protein